MILRKVYLETNACVIDAVMMMCFVCAYVCACARVSTYVYEGSRHIGSLRNPQMLARKQWLVPAPIIEICFKECLAPAYQSISQCKPGMLNLLLPFSQVCMNT